VNSLFIVGLLLNIKKKRSFSRNLSSFNSQLSTFLCIFALTFERM